ACIVATAEDESAGVGIVANLRIVSGCDELGAERIGPAEHLGPLDLPVAHHAGIRRVAREISLLEVLDDLPAERLGEIVDIVGDAESCGDPAGIVDAVERTATGLVPDVPADVLVSICLD